MLASACSDSGSDPADTSDTAADTADTDDTGDTDTDTADTDTEDTADSDTADSDTADSDTEDTADSDTDTVAPETWPWPASPVSIPASDAWQSGVALPTDGFMYRAPGGAGARWVKFVVFVGDPTQIFFQDSNRYTLHYDFATAHLPPLQGLDNDAFDAATLYNDEKAAILGALLVPGGYADVKKEYGVQLAGVDAYPPVVVETIMALVADAIASDDPRQGFYFPAFEQQMYADAFADAFADRGVTISSTSRWLESNVCYARGWSVGRLVEVAATAIDQAWRDGILKPGDILLTDGVPAEVPPVAGIITTTPSTPNSHVAILANDTGIPFVYAHTTAARATVAAHVGETVVVRAEPSNNYDGGTACNINVVAVGDTLTTSELAALQALKAPLRLEIQPMAVKGAVAGDVSLLTPADTRYFGGKASQFGLLRRTIPENSPVAVALSFDLYNGFMDQAAAGGGTLRAAITAKLAAHQTYPPDFGALASDLVDIRAMVIAGGFNQSAQDAVLNALADYPADKKLRFRSSTNVEDTAVFTGAGLYSSYSGCRADDLDADTVGPSLCNPDKANERGVFRAIRKVYASFFNDNAYLERLRHGVDAADVGMAILVHRSFPDVDELANGVATYDDGAGPPGLTLVTQAGANSVTNPDGAAQPEVFDVAIYSPNVYLYPVQSSSLVPLGTDVLGEEATYRALVALLQSVGDAYKETQTNPDAPFILDFEYKLMRTDAGP
ncbi:MAG: hypothetical protein ACI9MR_003996, partial [Myxococcota bacterium]